MYSIFVMTKPSSSASIPFELAKKLQKMNVPEPTPTLYVLISVSDPDGSNFFADPNPDFKNPGMDPYLLRKKKNSIRFPT